MSGQARALIQSMPKDIATAATALSFDEAFTLHHRAVFRTARAVVRDSALAEDVTQEVFLRLYRNLDSTPGEELLRAWLLRVTLNVARNTIRGQSRSAAVTVTSAASEGVLQSSRKLVRARTSRYSLMYLPACLISQMGV